MVGAGLVGVQNAKRSSYRHSMVEKSSGKTITEKGDCFHLDEVCSAMPVNGGIQALLHTTFVKNRLGKSVLPALI